MNRDIKNLIADTVINGQSNGIYYYPQTTTTFSGGRNYRFVGIADSRPINGVSVLTWHQLQWITITPPNTNLYVFVRQGKTLDDLNIQTWQGPFLNSAGEDISRFNEQFLQIRIAMYVNAPTLDLAPVVLVSRMQATCYLNGEATALYTKLFDLSFIPKHMLLTYNGKLPTGSLVQFAIAGKESTNNNDYMILPPNAIQDMSQVPNQAEELKLKMSIFGNASQPVMINDFGFLISGNGMSKLL